MRVLALALVIASFAGAPARAQDDNVRGLYIGSRPKTSTRTPPRPANPGSKVTRPKPPRPTIDGPVGLGFSLFFVTALFGRVWCGWACPQTVFLDHVYRRIENWIDGDAVERRRLHHAPWTGRKIFKRVVKHTCFILFSALITHLFLAYYVSLPEVWEMVSDAPSEHWGAFGFIVVATGLLYFNYAWFREQLCIVICPYGRMQSFVINFSGCGYPAGTPGAVTGSPAFSRAATDRFSSSSWASRSFLASKP